jgi:predicted metal-dependent hydrolase
VNVLLPQSTQDAWLAGLDAFRQSDFYLAHDHWEEGVWRHLPQMTPLEQAHRSLVQALIQVCVSLVHRHRGNCHGADRLWQKAYTRWHQAIALLPDDASYRALTERLFAHRPIDPTEIAHELATFPDFTA